MSLTETIEEINRLNERGIVLGGAGEYGEAQKSHEKAADIALSTPGLNPDYYLISQIGVAYARRKTDEKPNPTVRDFLEDTLTKSEQLPYPNDTNTFYGKARLDEERGVVERFLADQKHPEGDMHKSLNHLVHAKEGYRTALEKPDYEIVELPIIQDKYARAHGLISTVLSSLAKNQKGDERIVTFGKSVEFVQEEIRLRESYGMTEDFGYINAHHTAGFVLMTMQDEGEKTYSPAMKHLRKAKDLAIGHSVQAVVNVRLAWTDYVHNPENSEVISTHLTRALDIQEKHPLSPDELSYLRPQMEEMGTHIGGELGSRVDALYARFDSK